MSAFPALYRHILYRLYRLRRLIACSVLVVVAGAALSWLVAPSLSLFGDPANLLALMLFWTAIVALSAVMFPTGWIDTLTASIAFALLLTATPYLQLAIAGVGPGGTGISQGMAVMLIFLAWFLLWLLVMAVFIAVGTAMTTGRGRHRTVISTDLDPDEVRRALCPLPGTELAGRICGPEDGKGFFPVRFTMPGGDRLRLTGFDPDQIHWVRILQEDHLTRQSEAITVHDGRKTRCEMFERLQPVDGGTQYELVELHDQFNLLSAIGFWINDFGADHARTYLDAVRGRKSCAIFSRPRWSPVGALSRLFTRPGQP
ncbi:hypothetical protein DZD18_13900 [Rhodobacteraceae bacterium W635]|uniref:hypothetical protein n=1 Tax=Nioella halotolerans TaxID=2303578 RepID=UPI000E3C886F|nr:hypothetical protein DZD18_13900 [Rhodobacteraceae bacterium W635]